MGVQSVSIGCAYGRPGHTEKVIPANRANETLPSPRLTRGRCRRALQCETRAARRWRPRSIRARPRKERRGRTRALPAAVPGDPFLRCRARMSRPIPLRARPSRPAPLTIFQPGALRAGGRRVPAAIADAGRCDRISIAKACTIELDRPASTTMSDDPRLLGIFRRAARSAAARVFARARFS